MLGFVLQAVQNAVQLRFLGGDVLFTLLLDGTLKLLILPVISLRLLLSSVVGEGLLVAVQPPLTLSLARQLLLLV